MSANITMTNGKAEIVLARTPAWHRMGEVLSDCFTFADGLKRGHIDWLVEKRQLLDPITKQPTDAWGTFRADTGALLGVVSREYSPIQNASLGDVMDALVSADGGAHYEVIGSLDGGKRVWALLSLGTALRIAGTDDVTNGYLLGLTAHDGSMANRYYKTMVRVVCQNTWRAAEQAHGDGAELRIRHTGETDVKIADAKAAMAGIRGDLRRWEETFNALAARQVKQDIIRDCMLEWFPRIRETTDKRTGRILPPSEAQRNRARDILKLFEHNDGNAVPQVRGSAWNLYNAVTEYVDHGGRTVNGQQSEKRTLSAMVGAGDTFKMRALDTIMSRVKCELPARTGAGVDRIMSMVAG